MKLDAEADRPAQHRLTLAFRDRALEHAFATANARGSIRHHRVVVAWLTALWLAFAPLDILYEHRLAPAIVRLCSAPFLIFALAFGWARPATFERYRQLVLAVVFASVLVGGTLMCLTIDGPARVKDLVLGVCLINLAGHTLLGLRFFPASLVSALGAVVWALTTAFAHSHLDFGANLAWVMCASGMGMLGSHSLESLRRREFLQTRLLEAERAQTERLLLNVLPEAIAARLRDREGYIADTFSDVTVLFGDLVGFTALSARMAPEDLVKSLDELFSAFDDIAQRHGLEKIKTIGDAYMVVGGLPTPRSDHAQAVADMALEMKAAVAKHRFAGECLEMRIGVHTGKVVAGVIGKRKFIYDLWGDTVNTASRMESHGVPGAVQVSEATYRLLEADYELEPRGSIDVKGKGPMAAYLLRGRREGAGLQR